MRLIDDLSEANQLLKEHTAHSMEILYYDISLHRIALRLTFLEKEDVACIIGIGCKSIRGDFSIYNTKVSLLQEKNSNKNILITKIVDSNTGFELVLDGGFVVAIGEADEFGTSLDNLIKDIDGAQYGLGD